MKATKIFLLTLAAILGMTGAWAQDAEEEVAVTKTANNNEWTLTMPASDVELQVEYETSLALSEATDNANALTEWNGCEADVTLTRTLQAGSYNTFAVPFSMTIPSGWTEKPTMQVIKTDMEQQILAGSITGVSTTGLDAEEELVLPGEGLPKTGSVWDDAW